MNAPGDRHFPAYSNVCSGLGVHTRTQRAGMLLLLQRDPERDACHGPPAFPSSSSSSSLRPPPIISSSPLIAPVVPSRPRRANRSVRFLVNASEPPARPKVPVTPMDFNPLRFMSCIGARARAKKRNFPPMKFGRARDSEIKGKTVAPKTWTRWPREGVDHRPLERDETHRISRRWSRAITLSEPETNE